MSVSSLLLSLFRYKAWADAELFVEVAKVDAAAHPNERHTALRLLNHIHVVDRIFAAHLAGVAHAYTGTNTSETPTLEGLRAAVAETDGWYLAHIDGLAPGAFGESLDFSFTDGQSGRMTREEMLAHVATHGGYHRGAVGRIIAQLAVPPPRDIYTVYLHQAEPGRRLPG